MALLECPKCGNKVSSLADKCQNCGYPVLEMINKNETSDDNTKRHDSSQAFTNRHFNRKSIVAIVSAFFAILCIVTYITANQLTPEESIQVQKVYNQIESIGEVKSSSQDIIETSEDSFYALSSKCQHHVKNRKKLKEARKQYDNIRAELVSSAINDLGDVQLTDALKVVSIRNRFNDLTDAQKKKVKNYADLERAETTIGSLQVENAISLISQIGNVSLASEKKIVSARIALDALSESQKDKVTNISVLEDAEETIVALSIDNCISLINQIGAVSLESGDAIATAESAYEKIPKEKQSNISNYGILKNAESEYNRLKAEKAEANKKADLQNTIRVSKVWCSYPNSAGGVDAYVSFTNKSSKTIKYITWTVIPYNAVGDVVYSEIGYKSEAHLSDTGPYAQGQGHGSGWYWSCVWYNSTITSIKLSEIEIEYTDGSNKTISGNDINYVCY